MKKLAFLLAFVTRTYACSCPFIEKQEAFCKVDFVSHAKVVSKSTEDNNGPPEFKYDIEHMEVFRKPEQLSQLPTKFSSQSLDELCGIELDLGKEYLLSGYISEDGMSGGLTHCPAIAGLLGEWDRFSEKDKSALSTYTCE